MSCLYSRKEKSAVRCLLFVSFFLFLLFLATISILWELISGTDWLDLFFSSSPSRPFKKCSMMRVVQLLPPLESARLTFSKIEARKHIMPFKKYISYFFFFFCFDPNNIIKRSRHFCGQPIIQIWHVRKLFKKKKKKTKNQQDLFIVVLEFI